MARLSNDQRLANLHSEALAQFDDVQSALRDERLQCLQDRRFYSLAGAQWEGPLWDQYENKPKFEVNKIMLAVIRVVNEYRNNRITVDFVSKDGAENDKLAVKYLNQKPEPTYSNYSPSAPRGARGPRARLSK